MKKAGMVTGTFDPITIGHLDIIKRASALFDTLYVVLLTNPEKTIMFSVADRIKMLRLCTTDIPNVEVQSYDDLAIHIAKDLGASYFVRGIRNEKDFEYETEMRNWNFEHGNIDTLFLPCADCLTKVSSTKAKEQIKNGDYSLLPSEIIDFVKTLR